MSEKELSAEAKYQVLMSAIETNYPWAVQCEYFKHLFKYRSPASSDGSYTNKELEDYLGLLKALDKSESLALRFEMDKVVEGFLAEGVRPIKETGRHGLVTANRSSIENMFTSAGDDIIKDCLSNLIFARYQFENKDVEHVCGDENDKIKQRLRVLAKPEIERAIWVTVDYLWQELHITDWFKKAVALRQRLEKETESEVVFTDLFELQNNPDFAVLVLDPPYAKANDFRNFSGLGRGKECQMVFRLRGGMLVLDQVSRWGDEEIIGRHLLFPPSLKRGQILSITKTYLENEGSIKIESRQFFPSAFEQLGLQWPEVDLSVNQQPDYVLTLESQGAEIHSRLEMTKPDKKVIEEKNLLIK